MKIFKSGVKKHYMFWTNVEWQNVKISICLKMRLTTNNTIKNKILATENKSEIVSKIYDDDDDDANSIKLL